MRLVKKVRLVFREGKSDKVYEVDLVELPGNDAERYLVNFRFGRRGSALREGTKTARAVSLAEAEKAYQSVVVSKTNSGYWDESGDRPASAPKLQRSESPATPVDPQVRIDALLKALGDESDSKRRGRLIWSLGQNNPSPETMRAVTACIGRGDWLEDYSVAWTLGRWRDPNSFGVLGRMRNHKSPVVASVAHEASLVCQTPAQVAVALQSEKTQLPAGLLAAIDTRNEADVLRVLQSMAGEKGAVLNDALMTCYRLALVEPALARALLDFFKSCAIAPGVFKAVRHVFKTAEMRLDYDMFACLALRFDTATHFFRNSWDHIYVPGQGSIAVSKEMGKANSRLAYSQTTRAYLQRRSWRALRRLGSAGSPHYVPMATAALLCVTDAHAVEPRKRELYRYDEEDGRTRKVATREYDEYAHLTLFNHILRGDNPAYKLGRNGKAWYRARKSGDPIRGEPFAALWNRTPAAALDLLKRSRCGAVHDAAIRMLAGQTEFLAQLSAGEVAQLLLSTYAQTNRFALPLAQELFRRGAADEHLLLALLRSPLPEARAFGLEALKSQTHWVADQSLLIELLLIFAPPIPEVVDAALAAAPPVPDAQRQIVAGAIAQLLAREMVLSFAEADALAQMLARRLPAAVAELPLPLVDRLLSHTDGGKQLLGARLLSYSSIKFGDIPARLMQHIQESPHDEVRAIAIALLAKQSPDELLRQMDMLAELFHRGGVSERRELLGLFEKFAQGGAEHEQRTLRALSALLFRSAQDQAQGEELSDFFLRRKEAAARVFDKDTVWRLLQAQATAAQRVGAALLVLRPATDFSVKQWALLAKHSDLAARRYAMAAYVAQESLIKQHTRDALRMLDTPWDDAREFGFKFFRERYPASDWSPEYIIGVCDSTREDVQAFGRELLQAFFQQDQGPIYLTALSEHPSINVQLFVSGFLENHAAGHRERILALRGYFVTVLSQINRARVCKDRVLDFLLREALRDAEVANLAAEVFTRASLSVVKRDRGQLIKALIALRSAFPNLALPIKPIAPARTTPAGVARGI